MAAGTLAVTGEAAPRRAVAAQQPVLAAHNDTSTPFNLVHLPRLGQTSYDGRWLRLRLTSREDGATHHSVSYRGAGLTITGTLTRPDRRGRFPLVVLAHGYHHPSAYDPARVSRRERLFLARRGFVVLQPDYRNYGGSTREDDRFVARPTGYAQDLLNAVRAVRRANLAFVRRGPVHLFGRSMGGGVALQAAVARPAWVRSLVLSSPISSRAAEAFYRWAEPGTELRAKVLAAYDSPYGNPAFWGKVSVGRFLHRLDVPVHVHHGTQDDVCPLAWGRRTVRVVRAHGGRARLHSYAGAGHTFRGQDWQLMMRRTVAAYR